VTTESEVHSLNTTLMMFGGEEKDWRHLVIALPSIVSVKTSHVSQRNAR
jgi:hypothetical protein